jgi:oligopeptide transport system substrate-binding protein
MMMAWDSKTLDYVGLSGDYVAKYNKDPGYVSSDMAAMFFLSFNETDQNLANKNLRLALSLSVDKKAIVDSILNNGSRVADYIIPAAFAPDSTGKNFRDNIGDPAYNSMDKTKAAEYWEAAKKELGVTSLSLDLLYNEDSTFSSVCAFLQSEWQQALPGLTINLVQTTYNDRLDRMSSQNYQIGLTRWYADYPDPSTYLDMWASASQMNYGKYSNPDYDALDAQINGKLALKEQERIQVMKQMESIILGDAAICPLYQLASCSLQNQDYNWVQVPGSVMVYQWISRK